MTNRDFRRFQRGSGVFECRICGKKTRDTGDNGSVGLCPKCFDEVSMENEHNDCHDEFVEGCPFCEAEKYPVKNITININKYKKMAKDQYEGDKMITADYNYLMWLFDEMEKDSDEMS